jgi:hypothetical protein
MHFIYPYHGKSNISYMVSDMGIIPDIWGPYVWASIHLICLGAPSTLDAAQQQAYRSFFYQLPYVIPCATCAQHLRKNLTTVPIDGALTGRDDLFAWSVNLHNLVNQQLQKPTMPLEDAKQHWTSIAPLKRATEAASQRSPSTTTCALAISHERNTFAKRIAVLIAGMLIGAALAYGALSISKRRRKM